MFNIVLYFLTGGIVTTAIVLLEESGGRTLSALAAIIPIFTLIAYLFIGQSQGGVALSENAKLTLVGTAIAWVPYMLIIIRFAPQWGTYKTIGVALAVFFVLAIAFLLLTQHFGWFQ